MSVKTRRLTNFFYACLITFWAISITYACILIGCGRTALVKEEYGQLLQADFVRFYACGKMALSEDRHKVYDQEVQRKYVNVAIAPDHSDDYPYIQYPPIAFPIMAPFALMPPLVAFNVWNLVTAALGLAATGLLLKHNIRLKGRISTALMLCAVYCSTGSIDVIRAGQVNWIQFAAIAMFWVFWFAKKDLAAGAVIGLTIFKPQYSFICLLPALAYKRWKLLGAAAVSVITLLAISALFIGPENIIGYPAVLLHIEGNQKDLTVLPRDMYCLRAPLSWLLPLDIAFKVSVLLWALGALIIYLGWRRIPQDAERKQKQMAAFTALWALLFSPHAHSYDTLLLALPAVLTMTTISPYDTWRLKPGIVKYWHLLYLLYPILGWVFFIVSFNPAIAWGYVDPFGNLLITAVLWALALPQALHAAGLKKRPNSNA